MSYGTREHVDVAGIEGQGFGRRESEEGRRARTRPRGEDDVARLGNRYGRAYSWHGQAGGWASGRYEEEATAAAVTRGKVGVETGLVRFWFRLGDHTCPPFSPIISRDPVADTTRTIVVVVVVVVVADHFDEHRAYYDQQQYRFGRKSFLARGVTRTSSFRLSVVRFVLPHRPRGTTYRSNRTHEFPSLWYRATSIKDRPSRVRRYHYRFSHITVPISRPFSADPRSDRGSSGSPVPRRRDAPAARFADNRSRTTRLRRPDRGPVVRRASNDDDRRRAADMNTGSGHGAHGPSSLPNWWPVDPRHSTSTASDVMSQLCRVCGEPAAGFHFGAFTCEGCKSFFGRTYNNLGSISECKNNGECVINKKNRTSCKACRLRKCLVVGMSKSGSRYGRRSNWFKIHCLLQEQQQQQQHQHHQQHRSQQHQQQHQQLQHRSVGVGLHFQQHSVAGRTPPLPLPPSLPPPPPPSWADVKHHMRLDADNNNSVAGDLNKQQDYGVVGTGGRLSASAAAAAAAVVQAVRPELLRWPSPFFPAFPFPPPAPFFMAAMQPAPHHGTRSPPTDSPASRSSSSSCTDDHDRLARSRSPAERVAVRRDLLPVQESPMDLSVSSAAAPPSPSPSPSSSPSIDENGVGRSRSQLAADRTSGSGDPDVSESESDSEGSAAVGDGERTAKNLPLDLTYDQRA